MEGNRWLFRIVFLIFFIYQESSHQVCLVFYNVYFGGSLRNFKFIFLIVTYCVQEEAFL